MARTYVTNLDMNQNEVWNAVVQNLGAPPGSPKKGQLYFDSGSTNTLYYWDGSAWVAAKSGAPSGAAGGDLTGTYPNPTIGTGKVTSAHIADGTITDTDIAVANKDGAFNVPSMRTLGNVTAQTTFGASSGNGSSLTVARADHTHGTPAHDAAAHNSISLSALAAPFSDVNWGGFKITNLAEPAASSDAATKNYVDNAAQGLDAKASVKFTTLGDVGGSFNPTGGSNGKGLLTNAGGFNIDGGFATGDRILVKNQTTPAQNGIYILTGSATTMERTTDMDAWAEFPSAYVWVEGGSTNADTGWVCTADAGGTLNTTANNWVQFAAAAGQIAGAGLTKTGNTFDFVAGDNSLTVNPDNVVVKMRPATAGAIATYSDGIGVVLDTQPALLIGSGGISVQLKGSGGVLKDANGLYVDNTAFTPTSRTISTIAPLSGGGALTGNLTLGVSAFTSGAPGVVPASGGGTTNFLRADGTWAAAGGGTVKKVTASCAAATSTAVDISSINSRDVNVTVYRSTTPWDEVECDVEHTSATVVTVRFASAPAAGAYNIVVTG